THVRMVPGSNPSGDQSDSHFVLMTEKFPNSLAGFRHMQNFHVWSLILIINLLIKLTCIKKQSLTKKNGVLPRMTCELQTFLPQLLRASSVASAT
ncbi:hypothetical protein L9F63_002150, partial [Diploptera punctata]